MTIKTLKMTAAAIALTAGTAWAGSHTSGTAAMEAEPTQQAETDQNKRLTETAGSTDAPVRYTEENVRAATEGQINIADGGGYDFSDTQPTLSGDVDDDGTIATDDSQETADVPVDANKTYVGGETVTPKLTANQEMSVDYTKSMISEEFGGMTAGDLVGLRVYAADGERIGEIDNVVRLDGKMAVVVGIGGFLGFGAQEVAVPLNEFEKGGTDEIRLVQMTADQLKTKPEFDASAAEELGENIPVDEKL
ncbi:MAG: PRC-barrel domain-containing protein [Sulfitobacter sp.]|nr:PRC-barrel domain-containing protein [Sulfitobacter sp.]